MICLYEMWWIGVEDSSRVWYLNSRIEDWRVGLYEMWWIVVADSSGVWYLNSRVEDWIKGWVGVRDCSGL